MHRLVRKLAEISRTVLADPDEPRLGVSEVTIIEDVAECDGTTVSEIAARTELAQSYVSRTVAKLRTAGVFTTAADPTDRRRGLVRIAPAMRRDVFRARGARPIDPALAGALGEDADRLRHTLALLDELAAQLLDTE